MPVNSLTNANVGVPIPLSYGFNRVTGNQLAFTILPPSTLSPPYPPASGTYPLMQVGLWSGGEGEWDGVDGLWINNNRMLAYSSNGTFVPPDPTTGTIPPGAGSAYTSPIVGTLNFFNFHSGYDGQGADALLGYFNGLITSLGYSRLAYWAIGWTPQIGTSPGNMTPVLDMRCMRCRIFDADGNQTGYQFTTNPIWHLVDLYLRRIVKPEYHIVPGVGADSLTDAEQNCFRWDIIAASAAACDSLGFTGSYAFAAGSSVSAIAEQMLLVCRGYRQTIANQLAFFVDQARSPVFTVTGEMLLPGTFQADDTIVHQNPNRYIAGWLETGLPAVCEIATIVQNSDGTTTITTTGPNPAAVNDFFVVGGVADSTFDSGYSVTAVSGGGVITAVGGSAASGDSSTGGYIGYLESRFSSRSAEAPPHQQHQAAMGQVLAPNEGTARLKRVKVSYNFANSTWVQAMEILLWERYRDLGADASPYTPPSRVQLTLWSESVDAAGNILWQACVCGNLITLDATAFYEYAGVWEIIEIEPHGLQVDPQVQGGSTIPQPSSGAGTITLTLWAYDAARYSVTAPPATASFQIVPGSFLFGGTGGAGWALTGGTVHVAAASGPPSGPYEITVTWTGVTATAPDGSLLTYTDGGAGPMSNQFPVSVVIYDPASTGGNCVSVYVNGATLPVGAVTILGFISAPALSGSASYTL